MKAEQLILPKIEFSAECKKKKCCKKFKKKGVFCKKCPKISDID